jgi:hemerythrin superfamily protein
MGQDVVDLIMQDHREVERIFEVLRTDRGQRAAMTPVLTTLLTAHSRAEEAEVYPAARDEAAAADKVAHSQEEHVQADELLEQLAQVDPESSEYDDALEQLVEAVAHHVEEEESSVLPALRDGLSSDRLAQLGDAFLASRAEHLGEQPEDITRDQLRQQAANAKVGGTSTLGKDELQEKLRAAAGDE